MVQWFGGGSAVVRLWFGVDCSLPVAKSRHINGKSKEARQNRAFFTGATRLELKQTREQGDFEMVRRFRGVGRTDQLLGSAEQINDLETLSRSTSRNYRVDQTRRTGCNFSDQYCMNCSFFEQMLYVYQGWYYRSKKGGRKLDQTC